MRIGLDLLPLQSQGSRDRGVGRYARNLIHALLDMNRHHEIVTYESRDLEPSGLEVSRFPNARSVVLNKKQAHSGLGESWTDLVDRNPHALDTLLIMNPFELEPGYHPPAKPLNGLCVSAIVYDFIPQVFPETYLADSNEARRYRSRLATIEGYDTLLAISESTRSDAIRRLGIKPEKVVTIGGAVDECFKSVIHQPRDRKLETLEVQTRKPNFILHVGGRDDRKNIWTIIDSYRLLPDRIRNTCDLVIVGHYDERYLERIVAAARNAGVLSNVMILGTVPQAQLMTLYRNCSCFVFPSLYEGLGLPILEAMACGAPVIAGRNSAQSETVRDAGILVDPLDARALTKAMLKLLTDEDLANEYRRKGYSRASRRSWKDVAISAIRSLEGSAKKSFPTRVKKRTVAIVAPFPPKRTGIADHAIRHATALADRFHIELFHTRDYIPDRALEEPYLSTFDISQFPRRAAVLGYDAVIYHMGNSWYHRFVYETWKRFPGIVVLHDYCLRAFHLWYDSTQAVKGSHLRRVLQDEVSGPAGGWFNVISEHGEVQAFAERQGLFLNREFLRDAPRIVVHSQWCWEQVRRINTAWAERTIQIPLGAEPRSVTDSVRRTVRHRFGLPIDGFLIGFIGHLTRSKMYEEAITAFESVAAIWRNARLVFAGKDWEGGHAQWLARRSRASDQILFLGPIDVEWYHNLVASMDVALSLRRPPTFGETSASLLDQLSAGVPTIATDAGSFSEVPESVVYRWRPARDGVNGLSHALSRLLEHPELRAQLSEAGIQYIESQHHWSLVTNRYCELVEELAQSRIQSSAVS